jgi:hypothetical protein
MTVSNSRRPQASRRTGWRLAVRSTSRAVLLVITCLCVGGMYLAVNAKVADAGRHVLTLESQKQDLLQANKELTAQLADLTAPERMMQRAIALGFRPANPDEIDYLSVPGYEPPAPFVAPRPPASDDGSAPMLSPAYTETLGEWLTRVFGRSGGQP